MTMQFRAVKAAIVSTLGAAEAGRFRTIGYQSQSQAAESIKGSLRSVRVYYNSGAFPKNSGSITGPNQHEVTFNIELAVSEPASADLAVLENDASTEPAKAAALLAAREADDLADESFDELADIVYQILMDARNFEFGLDNQVANRWVGSINKDSIGRQGGLITVTGSISLTLRVAEDIVGDPGVGLDGVDSTIRVEDQEPVTGVKTVLTP
jgi:hypothetical protein